jgi:hypothetical protein
MSMTTLLQNTMARIQPPDPRLAQQAQQHLDRLSKPPGSLGRLEELALRYVTITGQSPPAIGRKAVIVFAADHGVTAEGVSAYPQEVTAQMVHNFLRGGAAVNVLARQAGAEVRVVDIGVVTALPELPGLVAPKVRPGTANMTRGAAMSRQEAQQCLDIGITLAEQCRCDGISLLGTGDMGIGNTTPSSALVALFTATPVERVTGYGTGIDDHTRRHKVIDRITALHGTIGALAALRERELSGEGQCIDVCLADTGFSMTEIQCTAHLGAGTIPERTGNGQGLTNTYQTSDGWVLIAAMSDNIWPRLCDAIEASEWKEDPRFRRVADRSRAWQVIEARLQPWFTGRTMQEGVAIFSGLGIPISPVHDIAAAAHDPQLHERELLVEVPDPVAGRIHVSGRNIKLSRSEIVVGSAPVPGQHTEELLTSLLHIVRKTLRLWKLRGAVYRGLPRTQTAMPS